MSNVLTRKLELFGPLPPEDKQVLDRIVSHSNSVPARGAITREGDNPTMVHLVLEGFAVRCKTLEGGGRQIFAYMLPGDFCDLHVFVLREMDHDIEAVTPSRIVDIPRDTILEMIGRPLLARALWWATLVDEATLREWLVNAGQRDAEHRIAHLFCEMYARLQAIGLAKGGTFELPFVQADLASTLGLSPVHLNRCLRQLLDRNLVKFKSKRIVISDVAKLEEWSGFNANYLHLTGGKYDASTADASRQVLSKRAFTG